MTLVSDVEPPKPALRRVRRGAGTDNTLVAWLFAAPFVILFLVFMAWPVVSSFIMSFTDLTTRDLRDPFGVNFIGLENYTRLLQDPKFLRGMLNTGIFVMVGVPATIVLALAVAVALNSGIDRFRTFFRVGYYAPVVTSIVAIAVVWRFILQPDGLINVILGGVGIQGPSWLDSPTWALPSLIVMAVWRNIGTLMIIFLAGLQSVPKQHHEAAMVDGASAWRRFTAITLPAMRPTLLFGAVLIGVGFLQFFEEAFVMTRGGPLDSTLSATYFAYNQFGFGNYGYASAASYVLFVCIVIVTLIQFRLLRSKDS